MKNKIKHYLTQKNLGALQITGNWGCGKTFFIKNEFVPYIKEQGFSPIIVSLFGMQSLDEITKKIFNEYCKNISQKDLSVRWQHITNKLKEFIKAFNLGKDYIDISQLFDLTTHLGSILNDKTIICFDDFERIGENIQIADFLGYVNELIESNNARVIIISHEDVIDKDKLNYKEKVIGKTFRYTANIQSVFNALIDEYQDACFREFMKDNLIIKKSLFDYSENPENLDLREIKCSLSNIRTLQFALAHFHSIFLGLTKEQMLNDEWNQILANIWCFVLGISVEFKNNNISGNDRKYLNESDAFFLLDVNCWAGMQNTTSEDPKHDDKYTFAKRFIAQYFTRLDERYIYYEPIYTYITDGGNINYDDFAQSIMADSKKRKQHPSAILWEKFKQNPYYSMSNEEFEKNIKQLYDYVKNGQLIGLSEYVQVCVFFFPFWSYLDENKNAVKKNIKSGICKYMQSINTDVLDTINLHMVSSFYKDVECQEIITYIETQLDKAKQQARQSAIEDLKTLFMSDMKEFAQKFVSAGFQASEYLNIPVLQYIPLTTIHDKVQSFQPIDVMALNSVLEERYGHSQFLNNLYPEIVFIENLQKEIRALDMSKNTLSNHLITQFLNKTLDKAQRILSNLNIS